ncbi:hypothetical protein [Bacillus mojavensis]
MTTSLVTICTPSSYPFSLVIMRLYYIVLEYIKAVPKSYVIVMVIL